MAALHSSRQTNLHHRGCCCCHSARRLLLERMRRVGVVSGCALGALRRGEQIDWLDGGSCWGEALSDATAERRHSPADPPAAGRAIRPHPCDIVELQCTASATHSLRHVDSRVGIGMRERSLAAPRLFFCSHPAAGSIRARITSPASSCTRLDSERAHRADEGAVADWKGEL